MHKHQTPIEISNIPDLVRLVNEVKTAKRPRILKQDDEPVALIMPLKTAADDLTGLETFDFQPLDQIKQNLLASGYSKAEVNDMLEALSELPQYENRGIGKSS